MGVKVRGVQGVGSSSREEVLEAKSPMSGRSMFGRVGVTTPSSSSSSSSAAAFASRCVSTCVTLDAAFCSLLDCVDGSSLGEGFKCEGGSGFRSRMGVEVMVAFAPQRVSICTSACEANETVGFSGSRTPGLDPIKSIKVWLFTAMAAAHFVAFCFCSSLDIDFTGVLECDKIDVANGLDGLEMACEQQTGYDESPKWVENGI